MRGGVATAVVPIVALVVACGPKPRIPFDGSHLPPGRGWFCFPHTRVLGVPDAGGCRRSDAECYVAKDKYGPPADRCSPVGRAYCAVVARTGDPEHDVPECYPRREGCDLVVEERSKNFSASDCVEVP